MKQQSERAHFWRAMALRGAVAVIALLAVSLSGLLPPRTTHGGAPFTAPVASEDFYAYSSDCDPGSLHTAIDSGATQPTWQVPLVINIDDVQQCIATRGARPPTNPYTVTNADMQIDTELFKYAVIGTAVGYGTRLTGNILVADAMTGSGVIMVMATTGAAGSGQLIIGSEYFSYTGMTANSFTGVTRALPGSSAAAHTGTVISNDGDFVFATPASGNVLDVQTMVNDATDIGIAEDPIVVDDSSGAPSAGVITIDSERIKYTGNTGTSFTGLTRGFGGTTATTHLNNAVVNAPKAVGGGFDLEVGDAVTETGFTSLGSNHYVCIVNELLQFDPTASSGDGTNGGVDKLRIIGRGLNPGGISCGEPSGTPTGAEAQTRQGPGSGIRDTTRMQLLARFAPNAAHADTAPMSSPQTRSHNLTSYTLGADLGGGVFAITTSTKVYTTTAAFPPPPPPPYDNPTTETNYHYKSKGTFDTNTGVLSTETMLNYPDPTVCAQQGSLFVHIPSTIDWNADPLGNTGYGTFRIRVWLTNVNCTGTPPFLLGEESSIDGQAIGTNNKSTGLAASTDSDGDGCTNVKELTESQLLGGRRDPFNPDDYFNPEGRADGSHGTPDLTVRVADILMVVQQYHKDDLILPAGEPPYSVGYDPGTDRTALHPNAWNLGPGNGQQRVDDILAVVKQFHHDC